MIASGRLHSPHTTIKRARPTRPVPARHALYAGLVALSAIIATPQWAAANDRYPATPWGRGTPAEPCVVCHSLEEGGPFRYAPNLYGIVGAAKARERDWYAYSPALRRLEGTWTEQDLDLYLANASAFAPGTTKSIRVTDPEERQAIIDFLKTLSPESG